MFEKLMVPVRFSAAVLLLFVGSGLIAPQPAQAYFECVEDPGMSCFTGQYPALPDYKCGPTGGESCESCWEMLEEFCEHDGGGGVWDHWQPDY